MEPPAATHVSREDESPTEDGSPTEDESPTEKGSSTGGTTASLKYSSFVAEGRRRAEAAKTEAKARAKALKMKAVAAWLEQSAPFLTVEMDEVESAFGREGWVRKHKSQTTSLLSRPTQETSFVTSVTIATQTNDVKATTCVYCSSDHDIEACPQFLALTVKDRTAFLFDKYLCYGCYTGGHITRFCHQRRTCKKC